MKNYQYKVVASIVEQSPLGEVSYKVDAIYLPTLAGAKATAEEFAASVGGRVEKLRGKVDSSDWRYGLSAYGDNHRRYEVGVYKSYFDD